MPNDKYGLKHFAQACRKMLLEQTATVAEELDTSLVSKRIGFANAAELLHDAFEGQLGFGDPVLASAYWQLKKLFEDLRDSVRGTKKQEMRIYNYLEFDVERKQSQPHFKQVTEAD